MARRSVAQIDFVCCINKSPAWPGLWGVLLMWWNGFTGNYKSPCEGQLDKRSPSLVDVHVGNRVKMRRMVLKLSQVELGKHSGVTFQQIQKYEKGTSRVSASRLQEFAKLLRVPVAFFFEGLPSPDAKTVPEDLTRQWLGTRHGIALTKAFISIDDSSLRRSILALVEQIADSERDGRARRSNLNRPPPTDIATTS